MKQKLAIILFIMMLTGCTDSTHTAVMTTAQTTDYDIIHTEKASTTTSTHTEQTTPTTTAIPTISDTTVENAVTAPEEDTEDQFISQHDHLAPVRFTKAEVLWHTSESFSPTAIEEQIGYDTPIDITQLYNYKSATKFAENLPEELYREAVEHNYSHIDFDELYIGSEYADWLCSASYILTVDGPSSEYYYTRLFYIKDGKVTDSIMEGGFGFCQLYYDYTGENIIIATGVGIYSLPRNGGEPALLTDAKHYSRIHYISDEYMLYSDRDNVIEVYYFDTSENFMTDIYYGYQDMTSQGLALNTIAYYSEETHKYNSFNIISQEYDHDISASEFDRISKCHYNSAKNAVYVARASSSVIHIEDRSVYVNMDYNLDGLQTKHIRLLGFYNDRLYMQAGYSPDVYLLALDIENYTAYTLFFNESLTDIYSYIDLTLDPMTGRIFYYSSKNDTVDIVEFTSE